jgi:hypothetical protein
MRADAITAVSKQACVRSASTIPFFFSAIF